MDDFEAELQNLEAEIEKADISQTKQGVRFIQYMRECFKFHHVPLPTVMKDTGDFLGFAISGYHIKKSLRNAVQSCWIKP